MAIELYSPQNPGTSPYGTSLTMLAAVTKSFVRATGVASSRRAPLLSAQVSLFSTEVATPTPADEKPKRTKLKIPTKRAASLLLQLEAEAVAKSAEGKDIGDFKPGDSVEVQYLLNRTSGRVQRVKGVVLARRNRGTGSSFVIRNHIGGYGYEQKIFLHSPLLQSVKVLQEAFIHKGKKRVRRAKLFYLREKAPSFTTV
ncbi:hypothetical protein PF005_g7375 [Phytophthora fragariae]|uniref:50S ribosomal protein L19, chloroplastic n=2 Tax=Phytophthora TaxID=4783 RepID=A0A6A3YLE0_9STRA|nr:hypothetical protein PF003_g36075 [Phytophthora fragariae]KAE9040672.1 hypothetical protein PR002_g4855 [Phytophthora rubi]KAE8942201.1 hypothetical protein PF009_g8026 [Phytophthora fragariae]KAE9018531.1 hypothetical protein PF011_g6238 [Phytophthora fragariae]KAE9048332.1 hypothetical protein PR001_g3868 [Phytophthora rubi]